MTTEQTHAAQTEPTAGNVRVPEGWQLVPVEPTEEMFCEGYDATRMENGYPQFADAGFVLGHAGEIYRAMLAAAPSRDCLATTPVESVGEAVAWQHRFRSVETNCDRGEWGDWRPGPAPELITQAFEVEARPLFAHPPAPDANEIERLTMERDEARMESAHLTQCLDDVERESNRYEKRAEAAETALTEARQQLAESEARTARCQKVLEGIACFDDHGANEELRICNSYSAFDEPDSVRMAREALSNDGGDNDA